MVGIAKVKMAFGTGDSSNKYVFFEFSMGESVLFLNDSDIDTALRQIQRGSRNPSVQPLRWFYH